MSEAKFTKGDWEISQSAVGVFDRSDSQSYGMLKQVCWIEDQFCDSNEEAEANANLIKAAPKLYEFLESLQLDKANRYIRDALLAESRGE